LVLGLAVLFAEPVRLAALAALATLAAGGALLLSRRFVERAVAHAWSLQGRVFGAFADVLDGRLDLVASGLGDSALRELRALTSSWGAAGVNVATSTALAGRLPALAIAAFVATVVVTRAQTRANVARSTSRSTASAAPLGSVQVAEVLVPAAPSSLADPAPTDRSSIVPATLVPATLVPSPAAPAQTMRSAAAQPAPRKRAVGGEFDHVMDSRK